MHKILSKIAIAIASFAMVLGGVSIASINQREQAKPAYAETGDVIATFESESFVNYDYMEWTDDDWKLSWGGFYRCGFDSGAWKTIEEQGYTKYIDGVEVTADKYGWIIATAHPFSYINGFDFHTDNYYPDGNIYLTYSLDGETYSLVPFTEGEQGASIIGNSEQYFGFNSIRRAYYAIVVVSITTDPPSNLCFEYNNVVSNFYQYIDPAIERMTLSGPNATYINEDIELTITSYNFDPTQLVWTSSDDSIATVTGNGNSAIVHGVNKGTIAISVSTTGTNGIVFVDPFVVSVKRFELSVDDAFTSITLNKQEEKEFRIGYVDNNGKVALEAVSANSNIATVTLLELSRYYFITIKAGTICGASTTITLSAKDNNGAEGYHSVTKTIQVTVTARPSFGERITSSPDETFIYIATIDGCHFMHVTTDNNDYSLSVTDNFKEATVFSFMYGSIKINNYSFDYEAGVSMGYSSYDYYINTSNDKYPGILLVEDEYFLYYTDETTINYQDFDYIDDYEDYGTVSPSNVFCAYYAVDPGPNITPSENSIELIEGESTDIDAEVGFVDEATYEIISGAECIEEVTVSAVDEFNNLSIHIESSSNNASTAVIRVKDTNDDSVYTDITVRVKANLETRVESLLTQTQLSYHYEKEEDEFTFSNISMRFGGKINKDSWDQIDNDYGIAGFGVMITAYYAESWFIKDHLDMSVSAESNPDIDTEIVDYYMPTSGEGSMSTPPEVGDNYVYNLFHQVNYVDRYILFTAVAYIKLDNGDYVFMNQVIYSVASLAADYLAYRNCDNTTAGGSLAVLSTPQA